MDHRSWAIFFLLFNAAFISLPSTPGAQKLVHEGRNYNGVAALGRRSPWVPPTPRTGMNKPYDHPAPPPSKFI